MDQSILNSIKHLLGFGDDYTVFDLDVLIAVNSAFFSLNQIGVGPSTPFVITGTSEEWIQFFPESVNPKDYEAIKSYIYLKARSIVDPPDNSYLMDALNAQLDELLWRLNVQAEKAGTND